MGLTTALVGGAAMLGSAYIASESASDAASAQSSAVNQAATTEAAATNKALDINREQYFQNREDIAPWRETGGRALTELEQKLKDGPGEFTEDPGYQFRLDEGNKAIERSAAARGGLVSGRTAKALTRYSQDYASNEYDRFRSRWYDELRPLQSLAGVGQTAANTSAAMGQNYANTAGGMIMDQGRSSGSAYRDLGTIAANKEMAQGNITGNLISDIAGDTLYMAGRGGLGSFGGDSGGYSGGTVLPGTFSDPWINPNIGYA